ncbi:MAG: hypothetical protein SD837_07270 [Candidatus Electrothrix scaldis]|nr:MAG: hypothetical protein SD837_07270 [Candidatus Electrothrix sp. GW3-3]
MDCFCSNCGKKYSVNPSKIPAGRKYAKCKACGGKIPLQAAKKCGKCGYIRKSADTAPDWECPECGIVYEKIENVTQRKYKHPSRLKGSEQKKENVVRMTPRSQSVSPYLRILGVIKKAKELFGNLTEKISHEYAKERERSKSPLCRCKDCGKEISKRAESCPGCGASPRRKKQKSGCGCGGCLVFCFLGFIFFALIFGRMLPSFDRKTVPSPAPPANNNTVADLPAKPVEPSFPQTANTAKESASFQGIQYTVIKKEKQRIGNISKCLISIRLERKVTEDSLRNLALKLKKDEPTTYDLLFIFYLLPDMEMGQGAWAITHFKPNLEVKILGMTIEEEDKLLAKKTSQYGKVIKEWFDEGIAGGIYALVKRDGKFVMVTNFKDGSVLEEEMLIQKTRSGGIRLDNVEGNNFGEYYMIETDGNLGFYGNNGLFRTIHPIK